MGAAPVSAPAPPLDLGIVPVREYVLVGLTTAAVPYVVTGLVRLFAIRLGAVAHPRERDVHVTPIPRLGGVAMYVGVAAGMMLASHLPVLRSAFEALDAVAVLAAGGLIVLVGALDDRFDLDAVTKLAGQVTAAGVLVLFGVQWFLFWVPWGGTGGTTTGGSVLVLGQDQAVLLTVLMTVVLVNAMNMVDGLDGLAAGIGLIGAASIGAFSLGLLHSSRSVESYPPVLIAATLAGACLGFLPHNFQPARIFMGDSGSMLIGLMLAAASTSASGRVDTNGYGVSDALALLSPLLVVAAVLFVPLLDFVLAVLRRTRAGQHPFHADKMHLHHRLLEIGHSQRRAVLLIYLWAGVLAFGAVALTMLDVLVVAWTVGIGLLVALVASAVPRLRRRSL